MYNPYENIEPFIEKVKYSENIVIAGHISPDGDAISATLALAMILEKMGKKTIMLLEKTGDVFSYIKGFDRICTDCYENIKDVDLFISVDCGDIYRLGDVKDIFDKAKYTVNIDHHASNDSFADLNIVNIKSSSTSEIIFEIANYANILDIDIATAIYTGIVFDSGGFKFNCTTKRTHQIAGELVEMGVDTHTIHSIILSLHSLENSRLLAKAIDNIYVENDIIISTLSKDEIEKCNATSSDTGNIVQYLLDTKNVNISVFIYEKEDVLKVSFRSKTIDVNKIASTFGGGGHILASGATIKDMTIEEAKADILKKIKNI